jgi:hypothetical protein
MTYENVPPQQESAEPVEQAPVPATPVESETAPVTDTATPVAPAPVDEAPTSHVVTGDDTLASIGDKYGLDAETLYHYNAGELDRAAAARGFGDSEGGRLLFSGTQISLQPSNVAPYGGAPAKPSPAAEIARLHALNVSGALTDEEFAAAKTKLLSDL